MLLTCLGCFSLRFHPLTPRLLLVGAVAARLSAVEASRKRRDRSRELLPVVRGFPVSPPQTRDRGSGVEQRHGLFTQLWGSPGPGEREDVFRASLIMAASEEINRQGPAGMLQLLLLWGVEERWTGGRERRRCVGVAGRPVGV